MGGWGGGGGGGGVRNRLLLLFQSGIQEQGGWTRVTKTEIFMLVKQCQANSNNIRPTGGNEVLMKRGN